MSVKTKWNRIKSMLKVRHQREARLSHAVAQELESRQMLTAVTAIAPYNGQQQVAIGANITATFDVNLNAATVTSSTVQLRDSSNAVIAAAVTYNSGNKTITIDPTANLAGTNNFYYVKLLGGTSGIKDTGGTALTSDFNFAFTTGTPIFNDTTVFSGLSSPTNVKFAPGGKIFVTEKSGIIKVFDSINDTTPDTVADLRINVHNFWDRGLLGLAIDPDFNNGRPYIYVLYTYDANIGGTAPTFGSGNSTSDAGTGPNGTAVINGNAPIVSGRLSRLTISNNVMVPGSELVLINDWAQQFPSHSVGELQFGPDKMLYASAGDGASFNTTDYGQFPGIGDPTNEGGALRAQDLRTSGDATGLSGSVIRINPDTGLAAADNPTTTGDENAKRIIAYGMRNPFRFTFRPGTNEIWVGDVGWNTWEELNRIISPTDNTIENFGWPGYEGPNRQGGYDALDKPLLEQLYAANVDTKPYFAYNHGSQIVSGSAEPIGGSSITGEAFYNGGQYPSAYDGALFFSDYSRKQIYVMYKGANGLPDPTTVQIFKSQANGSVYLTMGPNGDLFYVDMDLGRIGRFTFNSNNSAPTARIVAVPTSGPTPLTVNFDASTSSDPDAGDTLTYSWDLDGNGTFGDSTIANPSFIYTTAGNKTVSLMVTDRGGLVNIATTTISPNGVTNTAPSPVITSPLASLRWKVGDTITFAGGATDAQDGTLAASRLTWTLAMIHGNAADPASQHTHVIQTFSGVAGGSFVAPNHEFPSWLEIRLTAIDSGNLSTTTVVRVDPLTSVIAVNANIAGVVFGINSESGTGPFSQEVITNGESSVSAPASVTVSGSTYNFSSWSDGGLITHDVIAPTGTLSLTANYTLAPAGPVKLTGTIIGTTGSYQNNPGTTRDKAFDNDFATYFDSPESLGGNGAWVGLDLGSAKVISMIKYAPRNGHEWRMPGGKFQGSNTADFSAGVVDLFTITTEPLEALFTTANVTNTTAFRYVRYLSPDGGWGNISEVEFYTPGASTPAPNAPSGLTATAQSATVVNLAWTDNATNETGFRIERKTGAAGTYAPIATINTPNTTSYADNTTIASTQYYYRVFAIGASSDSAASNEANATTPALAPAAAPSGLVATAISASQINLTWLDNASTETGFRIERKTGAAGTYATIATINTINTTAYSDSTGAPSTQYYYRVFAIRTGAADSSASNEANATTQAPAAPAAPSSLVATAFSSSQIDLTWLDNANNETGFRIERKTGAAGTYAPLTTLNTANTRSYSDTTAAASTQYYYRVYAIATGAADSAASNEANATTPAATAAPAAPSGLTATAISSSTINLTWVDNATNETGFRIERKTGAAGTYAPLTTINTANTTAYSDTTGSPATQYYYRVYAIRTGNPDSAASNEATAITTPTSGTLGTATRDQWTNVAGNLINNVPVATTPTSTGTITSLEIPVNVGTNSADRLRGYIVAPTTGAYVFWVAGDDAVQFSLSTTNLAANLVVRAYHNSWTNSREWTKFTTQKSVAVNLVAGQQYYFEALHKQGSGGSSVAVGWSKPGQATTAPSEVIPGSVLMPFVAAPAPTVNAPTGLVATTQSSSAIGLTWVDNATNETGFRIERSINGGAYSEIGTVGANVTTFNSTGLVASTNYSYRVRAYLTGTNSSYSNVASATTSAATVTTTYLSDLAFVGTPTNGWGAVERDRSNGEQGATDGNAITLKGTTYAKGLGVHSNSEINFALDGTYTNFISDIGIDDETGGFGSVVFQVYLDGVLAFDSGVLTAASPIQTVNLSVLGKTQLKLVVLDSGDNNYSDHADWAGARLIK